MLDNTTDKYTAKEESQSGFSLEASDFPDDDQVNHPSHYQSMSNKVKIECIDAMRAAFGDHEVAVWCRINAFKYIYRADSKGGNTDIEKAIWYLKKFLELGGCDQ